MTKPTRLTTLRPLNHVGLSLDGNGRWAEQRGLPVIAGYRAGSESLTRAVLALARAGVPFVTAQVFTTDNWSRRSTDLSAIFDAISEWAQSSVNLLCNAGVRVAWTGHRERVPTHLHESLIELELASAENSNMLLTLAIDYGGREELVQASQRIRHIHCNNHDPCFTLQEYSATFEGPWTPDIDLYVRSGGRHRLSNGMLWKLAYSELYFTDTLWPDFTSAHLKQAIGWYRTSARTFGGNRE